MQSDGSKQKPTYLAEKRLIRGKLSVIPSPLETMGRRYCLHEHCPRLEFRQTGWCYSHKDEDVPIIKPIADLWWTKVDESLTIENIQPSVKIKHQCSGITEKGERCGQINRNIKEGGYCSWHILRNDRSIPNDALAPYDGEPDPHNFIGHIAVFVIIIGLINTLTAEYEDYVYESEYDYDYGNYDPVDYDFSQSPYTNPWIVYAGNSCSFIGEDLRGVDFTDYWWQKDNLDHMRISTYVDLSNCDFTNANLRGAILSGANLKNADFTNADLTFANLTSSVFQDTILVNADLAGAHLSIHPGSIYANHLVDDHYYPICVDIYGEDWKGRTILMNSADCTGLICPDGQPIGPGDYYPPNYLTQRAPEPCRAI